MNTDSLYFAWKTPSVVKGYRTAVSLHSHTQHSRESLDFIPRYAARIPGLPHLVRREEQRFEKRSGGRKLDFRHGWWTPPLSAHQAYDLERAQIERDLGLNAIVSLTDHDTIEAATTLRVLPAMQDAPISVEWTVPYGVTVFHIGVHNLPPRWAQSVMERLESYTAQPRPDELPEIFSVLHGLPSVLIVLNHPLWNEWGVGAVHLELLPEFLGRHKEWIHALELNGLRSWRENLSVARLATEWGLPVISGGDRHGCEPNALVNLTRASSITEFISEVRSDKKSEVLFLPQSREALKLRVIQAFLDVVRDYPDYPEGRRRWTDRVFFQKDDGCVTPVSMLWEGDGPAPVKLFMTAARLLQRNDVRNVLRAALPREQEI